MKTVKKAPNSNIKLAAVFVAGLALATLAWWQSDRLDLAFGNDASINAIHYDKTGAGAPVRECGPDEQAKVSRRFDGCEVVTSVVSCVPIRSYVSYRKTRSGYATTIAERATKRSMEQVAYKQKIEEKREALQARLEQTRNEITAMKQERRAADLQRDANYLSKIKDQQDMDLQIRRNPLCKTAR